MDVEDIAPGLNFAESIDRSLASSATALIVIGPRWIPLFRERLRDGKTDYVLHEVRSALGRKIRIIPVLVGGASMPAREDLPEDLSSLALQQAIELRDNSFRQDCERLAADLQLSPARPLRRKWRQAAIAAAIILLSVAAWVVWSTLIRPADPRLATARTQSELGEHRSAFETYREVLKDAGPNSAVSDLQAEAAMKWLPDFSVTVGEGQKAEDIAGPPLAEIMAVLEAALARTGGKGPRAGDILAHLGWAHWLNQRLAQKEFGPAAEQMLRQALTVDPGNVFAHAMLGNWLLQNNGDVGEALQHFAEAEKANRERPLLRRMQLGGILSKRDAGMPAALMRVLNQMRLNGEDLGDRYRSRALSYFRPGNQEEVREMLSAVPPAEAWSTFLWLAQPSPDGKSEYEGFRRDWIHAGVFELEGKPSEALALLTDLEARLKTAGYTGRLLDEVAEAARRLRSGTSRRDY